MIERRLEETEKPNLISRAAALMRRGRVADRATGRRTSEKRESVMFVTGECLLRSRDRDRQTERQTQRKTQIEREMNKRRQRSMEADRIAAKTYMLANVRWV